MNMDAAVRFPNGWNPQRMIMRGPLTDKKIADYEARGFYSAAFQQARREMWSRRKAKQDERAKRSGNFDFIEGRLIYNPR